LNITKKQNSLKKFEIQEVLTDWQKLHKNFFVNALSTLFAKKLVYFWKYLSNASWASTLYQHIYFGTFVAFWQINGRNIYTFYASRISARQAFEVYVVMMMVFVATFRYITHGVFCATFVV
jgi:hypothetical protein